VASSCNSSKKNFLQPGRIGIGGRVA